MNATATPDDSADGEAGTARDGLAGASAERAAGTGIPTDPLTIDQMLRRARDRLRRLSPSEAAAAVNDGAVLVDIRPEWQRHEEGTVPGALVVERNHLEWRFDPTCEAALPLAVDHDVQVVIMCSEGYTSSLAASSLQQLGLHRATDIDGGFHAWRSAGLPTGEFEENPRGH